MGDTKPRKTGEKSRSSSLRKTNLRLQLPYQLIAVRKRPLSRAKMREKVAQRL